MLCRKPPKSYNPLWAAHGDSEKEEPALHRKILPTEPESGRGGDRRSQCMSIAA